MSTPSRTALVTGAASGIGAAVADRLEHSGHRVVRFDVDAERLAERTPEAGLAILCDLADPAAVATAVERLLTMTPTLDVLVNAAGIGDAGPTADLGFDDYRRVLSVNLDGMVALTLGLLPLVSASATGRIVNIGSVQGLTSAADTLAYATSKGGVHAFTRSLAVDLAGDGVLVNAVAPGFVDTPMARLPDGTTEFETDWFRRIYVEHGRVPLKRPARPDEIAAVVEFLTSPTNTYLTGQIIAVDGGLGATF